MFILSQSLDFKCDQGRDIFHKITLKCIVQYIIAKSVHSELNEKGHTHHLLQSLQMPAPTGILNDGLRMSSHFTEKPRSQENHAIPRYPYCSIIFNENKIIFTVLIGTFYGDA